MSSSELQAWVALADGFAKLLRAQRPGRPVEEVALYMADLTAPNGIAFARKLHAARLGPDPSALFGPACHLTPRPSAPLTLGLLTAEEMVGVAESAGPSFERAAQRLREVPPRLHVRVLLVADRVDVAHIYVAVLGPSAAVGVA